MPTETKHGNLDVTHHSKAHRIALASAVGGSSYNYWWLLIRYMTLLFSTKPVSLGDSWSFTGCTKFPVDLVDLNIHREYSLILKAIIAPMCHTYSYSSSTHTGASVILFTHICANSLILRIKWEKSDAFTIRKIHDIRQATCRLIQHRCFCYMLSFQKPRPRPYQKRH